MHETYAISSVNKLLSSLKYHLNIYLLPLPLLVFFFPLLAASSLLLAFSSLLQVSILPLFYVSLPLLHHHHLHTAVFPLLPSSSFPALLPTLFFSSLLPLPLLASACVVNSYTITIIIIIIITLVTIYNWANI